MATHAATPFKLVGGSLSLDFVNTVSGRLPRQPSDGRDWADVVEREWLGSYEDLVRWGTEAGVLATAQGAALLRSAAAAPGKAARIVARARALREAIYRLFVAVSEGWRPRGADLDLLNRELTRARTRERLIPGDGRFESAWDTDSASLDWMLWPVLRSASNLLQSEDLYRVRRCDGGDCHWLYFDTSRSRNRRWCDMADCGNVAKVRKFRSG